MNTNTILSSESTDASRQKRKPAIEGLPNFSGLPKLEEKQRIAHWVKTHLMVLKGWNEKGWRWVQIAEGMSLHLEHPVTRNKLTGMVSMIQQQKLAKRIEIGQ